MIENLVLDIRKNSKKTFTLIFLIFSLICIIINQVSIGNYERDNVKQTKFLKLEMMRIEQYKSYYHIARYGFQIMSVSAPINILFYDSNSFPGELISSINSFEKLELYKQQKGRSTFEKPTGGVLDFSWFIMTIGSLIAMGFGWFLYGNPERIKYTINFTKIKWIWWKILLIKIPLLIAPLALIMLITGLQLLANGFWSSELIAELLADQRQLYFLIDDNYNSRIYIS